jgi:peptidoglycan hydrolase-like protein with peptidoglycan-binding domain
VRRTLVVCGLLVAVLATAGPAHATKIGLRTLIPGAHGKDVQTVQVLLNRVVASRISVDGEYGPQTTAAALEFETVNKLGMNGRLTRGEQNLLRTISTQVLTEKRAARALPTTADSPAVPVDPTATAAPTPTPAPATPTPAPTPAAPTGVATLNPDGTATPPPDAPPVVAAIIAAGNQIASTPYRYGGGHQNWVDTGYDCSGSVSYALHGAGILAASAPSGAFMNWGDAGPGTWVTLYSNQGHMYMIVAGLRFDTSGAKPSRWQTAPRSSAGFTVRHPTGL